VVSFTPQPLYPQGQSPWYPLDRRFSTPVNTIIFSFENMFEFSLQFGLIYRQLLVICLHT
jgi:hypothetical protein